MQLKHVDSKMESLKILEEKENPLFNRKEVKLSIEAQVTPSKVDVEKLISEKFSALPETIKIKGIHGGFGSKTFTISANIYKTREDLEKTEPKSKKEKELESKQAEPVAQEPAPTAPEMPVEAQSEQLKEEQKPEEKPADDNKQFENKVSE